MAYYDGDDTLGGGRYRSYDGDAGIGSGLQNQLYGLGDDGLALSGGQQYDSGFDTLGAGLDDTYGGGGLAGSSFNTSGLDAYGADGGGVGAGGGGFSDPYECGGGGAGSLPGAFNIPEARDFDNFDLSSGLGGIGGGSALDTLGSSSLSDPFLSGVEGGGQYDAGYGQALGGGLDSLGASSFDMSGLGGSRALDSGLDAGLDGLSRSYDSGLGAYSSGVDGYGSFGGVGAMGSGLDTVGYGGLAAAASPLESAHFSDYNAGFDTLGSSSLGSSGLGLGAAGYDAGFAGLGNSGWSTYDTGLDNLGRLDGSDVLGASALGLGGAALGAGAGMYAGSSGLGGYGSSTLGGYGAGHSLDRGLGYGDASLVGGGYGGLGSGLSSSLYGDSHYDRDLGLLGHTSYGYGAYDGLGAGSGLGSAGLQYADLANFENRLYTNNAIAQSERDSIMRDRLAFDALDDAARASTWNSYSPGYRSRLGLDTGYYGSQYGRGVSYDPAYSAFGYYSNPGSYYGSDYSLGYGNPNYYLKSYSSMPHGLTGSLRSRYSDFYGSGASSLGGLPYFSDDSRFREAADLAYYQQTLMNDKALGEAERMARWQQRMEWQQLDADARRLRWQQMPETERERLGLGLIGSWQGPLYAASSANFQGMSLPYELPSTLRSVYSPYMSGSSGLNTCSYMDSGYARYSDLLAWSNALKYDRNLQESERLARWRRRLEFEQLDELERRTRWGQMSYTDRTSLGLTGGYWDSRLGLIDLYDPRALRPMSYPVSSTLASMFKPYQSKNYFTQALRQGQESAIAFADLVSFENALRADRRLRDEVKLRRWRARVRWQELNERQRRLKFYQMQEAERRMLGLGLSSFFGRRYSAPLLMNGTRALPPPRVALPTLRTQLPPGLQSRFAPVLQRQPNLALAARMARQPELATSSLSRSLAGPDPTRDLANRIRLSIAQKTEQMPGLSQAQKLNATEQKRQILREMDNDRRTNQMVQMNEEQRLQRLRMGM